jgi:cell division protein FtsI (penicillin-binding protein 3)
VHKPNTSKNNYYGADVAGPVFKRIAQKIFTDVPSQNEIKNLQSKVAVQEKNYQNYILKSQSIKNAIPNVKGMPGMDALSLLENLGLKVKVVGNGKVQSQSINAGTTIKKNDLITINLS